MRWKGVYLLLVAAFFLLDHELDLLNSLKGFLMGRLILMLFHLLMVSFLLSAYFCLGSVLLFAFRLIQAKKGTVTAEGAYVVISSCSTSMRNPGPVHSNRGRGRPQTQNR